MKNKIQLLLFPRNQSVGEDAHSQQVETKIINRHIILIPDNADFSPESDEPKKGTTLHTNKEKT